MTMRILWDIEAEDFGMLDIDGQCCLTQFRITPIEWHDDGSTRPSKLPQHFVRSIVAKRDVDIADPGARLKADALNLGMALLREFRREIREP